MDAVNRAWRVFQGLVFERSARLWLLALFFIPGLFVPLDDTHWEFAFLLVFPVGALGIMVTERVIKCCASAAELGVPRHTPSVRWAQLLVIILFAIVPGVWQVLRGALALPVAALLFGGLALGTLVTMQPRLSGWFLLGAFCLGKLLQMGGESSGSLLLRAVPARGGSPLAHLLTLPAVQWAVLLLSAYQLMRWFGLPESVGRLRRRGGVEPAGADSAAPELVGEPRLRDEGGAQFSIALQGVTSARISAEALGVGLNFAVTHSWRARLNAAASGFACLAIAHFCWSGQYQQLTYLLVTAIAASTVAAGVLPCASAWLRTPVEQGLLLLTPRWPASKVVKLSMITVMFRSQMGGWIGWAPIALAGGLLGWVAPRDILFGMFVLFASMCSTLAVVWTLFALPSVRDTNVSTVALLLLAAAAVGCYWIGAVVLGFALLLGPTALALLAMLLRPLQFPVVRKSRRL